jgi:AraC family transcriptional regulator, regulatory protein of adaptative response / DNA-3-methyladenine glycosylase II
LAGNDKAAELRLPVPPGFDFSWAAQFLALRAVPALEEVVGVRYRRAVRLDGAAALLDLRFTGRQLRVRTTPALPAAALRRLAVRLFDLDADLAAFYALAERDPLLGPLVAARPGIRLQQFPDPFEGLIRAILGQQVSLAAAATLAERLVRLLGRPLPRVDGRVFLTFPTPEAVAEAGAARLAALGMPRAKAATLAGAAAAVAGGTLDWDHLRAAPPDEARQALVALPGIGPWTASYLRMRALGDRDAFPAADLGVIKALRALLPGRKPTRAAAEALAERWRPFRAYAALHLWRSLG